MRKHGIILIKNKIFFVTKQKKEDWEVFEIPFDTVHMVEWSGGKKWICVD